jgi:integrase
MGRKTAGIYKTDAGYEVDKRYKGERLRQCGFGNSEQAEAWIDEQKERIRLAKTVGQRGTRTFQEAAVQYLECKLNKPSIETDVHALKAVMPFIGHLKLDQIHNGTLKPFIEARKAQMRKVWITEDQYEMQPIKNKTVNHSLCAVRQILNLAARDWRDEQGMTWLATAPLITMLELTDQRPPHPIMWEDQRKLLPALPYHLAEMALFDLNTGVRDEVVCNLRWEWEVPIPQLGISVFVVPKEYVKAEEKRKTDRVLVCNTVAQSVIERQRGKHETHVFVYRRERVKNTHLDPKMAYQPIETINNTAWQNGRRKAGLGDLHVHDLRHTVGLRLREAMVKEETIAEVLWHSKTTMTGHYSTAQIVEVFEALEKIKDETNRWNKSLQSLIREAAEKRTTAVLPQQRKTG